jgi:uncharacterized protein
MLNLIQKVATELSLKPAQVLNTVKLLFEEDCTIPFVARYRKEMTGSLDEVKIRDIRDRYQYLQDLEAAKVKYLKVVEEHCDKNPALKGKFEELKRRFEACTTRQELDDLYLPFKPKRRTRAMIAKEKGLEPLLERILEQRARLTSLVETAAEFVTDPSKTDVPQELRVNTPEEALQGAADILAERINETADYRALVRKLSLETGSLVSKKIETVVAVKGAKKDDLTSSKGEQEGEAAEPLTSKKKAGDASKYENYFDYAEPLLRIPGHRIMAVRRGEAEKVLRVGISVNEEQIIADLRNRVLGDRVATDVVKQWLVQTTDDAYHRLMGPSIETELRMMIKTQAEDEAINVFSKNLENLLLLPPIPGKVVMGIDPGIRTGSKLAVVDETGKLLGNATIYPDFRKEDTPKNKEAKMVLAGLLDRYKVTCIAIGNGTGSREIDRFVIEVLKEFNAQSIKRIVVNEAGASVYSTEDIAREEFPDLDPTIRSAISIARRLQDPLAELVKITPRSIGVGQYQHDVNPSKLGKSLEEVVESCVNKVGVNVNTASYKLLGYVSGVGPALARNIVSYRDQHGKFGSRQDLQKVSGFGPKAFLQAAGFIRIPQSTHPLDDSGVHPERYEIVESIAKDLNKDLREIIGKREIVDTIPWERYVTDVVGLPTLRDIASELIKPGRDPREDGARLLYSDEISEIEHLKPGMVLKGTVTNVTNFGAFVDIGVHQDGLVHISELSDQFIKDPSEVVAVGVVVSVKVLDVDVARRRISLTCKMGERQPQAGQGQRQQQTQQQRSGASGAPSKDGHKRHDMRGPHQNQGHRGGGQPPRSPKPPKQPEKQFTVADLMAKFGKKA